MDTPTLPIFTPQPQLNDTNPNLLIYSLTLSYKDIDINVYLEFVPQTLYIPPPALPITNNNFTSEYYNLYSYQWFVDRIVNPKFTEAFTQLQAAAIAKGYTLPSTNAPFMLWDVGGNTAVLNCPLDGYDLDLDDPIQIYFNTPMYALFSSYSADYFGYESIQNGKNYLINTYNNQGLNVFKVASTGISYIQVFQEYSTAPLWNPVTAVVFCTALIPVVPELTAAPVIYGAGGYFQSNGNNSNLTNVLTDFVVPLTLGSEYKPSITYTPQSEFRFIDLFGTSPVSSINVSVFYKNRFGSLIPMTLGAGSSANIKILFRSKEFNNLTVGNY
jgi:hypothetical protein